MANRLNESVQRLRDRLRVSAGVSATITRGVATLATDVAVTPVDLHRATRFESEFILEDDDAAFLIGVDVLAGDPAIGDKIVAESITYIVTERPEIEIHWRWHDRERLQRIVFCKQF